MDNIPKLSGDAIVLVGRFKILAREKKKSPEEIQYILNEAMSKDEDHLFDVLSEYLLRK